MSKDLCEYIILDVETTGLDHKSDYIVQIAWMCLDREMKRLDYPGSCASAFVHTFIPIDQWTARGFHKGTGFLARYEAEAAAGRLCAPGLLDDLLVSIVRDKVVLTGNQVEGFDSHFLERQMPAFYAKTKWALNVSAVRSIYCSARGISTHRVKDAFGFNHDAMGDVEACYKELQFYRKMFEEGPKT